MQRTSFLLCPFCRSSYDKIAMEGEWAHHSRTPSSSTTLTLRKSEAERNNRYLWMHINLFSHYLRLINLISLSLWEFFPCKWKETTWWISAKVKGCKWLSGSLVTKPESEATGFWTSLEIRRRVISFDCISVQDEPKFLLLGHPRRFGNWFIYGSEEFRHQNIVFQKLCGDSVFIVI